MRCPRRRKPAETAVFPSQASFNASSSKRNLRGIVTAPRARFLARAENRRAEGRRALSSDRREEPFGALRFPRSIAVAEEHRIKRKDQLAVAGSGIESSGMVQCVHAQEVADHGSCEKLDHRRKRRPFMAAEWQ